MRVAVTTVAAAAAGGATSWTVVPNVNAVPSGTPTTEKDLTACEAAADGHAQFSFNLKSGHCYVGDATTFGGAASDRVTSGCDAAKVTSGCTAPAPTPPPPPTPAPAPTPAPVPTPPPAPAVFDAPWYADQNKTALSVGAGGVLTWDRMAKPDTIVTHFKAPLSLAADGDVAAVRMQWQSNGTDACPPRDWANHGFCKDDEPCMHTSVHCLAGTGDFRIGVLDSNGMGQVSAPGWCDGCDYSGIGKRLSSAPFSGYLGYSFRISPHVSTKAEHYKPKASGSTAVPCSFNFNGLKYPTHALSKERLAYNGCFEAPAGAWTDLLLKIERVSKSEAKLTMAMGEISYSFTHHLSEAEEKRLPAKIDTVLIEYPNSRHYTYVKLAPYGSNPP